MGRVNTRSIGSICPATYHLQLTACRPRSRESDPDQELRDKEIENQNHNRSYHHGLGGGFAYTLCAPRRLQALEAADQGNDDGEENRLKEALGDIVIVQALI